MKQKEQINSTETYSTDSFILASLLLAESCQLLRTDKTNPQRAIFVFEKNVKLSDLIKKFWAYEAFVEVHKFFYAQRDLKAALYDK